MILKENITHKNDITTDNYDIKYSLLEYLYKQDELLMETTQKIKQIEVSLLNESNVEIIKDKMNSTSSHIRAYLMSSKKFAMQYSNIFFKEIKNTKFPVIEKMISDQLIYKLDSDVEIVRYTYSFRDIPNLKPFYNIIKKCEDKKLTKMNNITDVTVSQERMEFFSPNNINVLRGRILGMKKNISSDEWISSVKKEFRSLQTDKHTETINKSNLDKFIAEFNDYKKIYSTMGREYNEILKAIDTANMVFNNKFKEVQSYINNMSSDELSYSSTIESYFALLFNEMNRVFNMTSTVFYEKMMAFNECIDSYKWSLDSIYATISNDVERRFVESSEVVSPSSGELYESAYLEQAIQLNREYYNNINRVIEDECNLMKYCYENALIDEEILSIVNEGIAETLDNVIDKILEIIDNLVVKFKKTNGILIEANNKWLEKNRDRLLKYNYNNLESVKIIPYWNINAEKAIDPINSFKRYLSNPPKGDKLDNLNTSKIETEDPYKKYLSKDGDFKTGWRNYCTVGSEKIEPIKATGAVIAEKMTSDIIPYIEGYEEKIVNPLVKDLTDTKSTIRGLRSRLSNIRTAKTEAYSILEETLLINTDLRNCLNFESVFEADEKSDSVVVTHNANASEDGNNTNSSSSSPAQKELEWTKKTAHLNQLAISIAMSVMEKRYRQYNTLCRKLLITSKPKKETKGNEEPKEKTTEKEETKK